MADNVGDIVATSKYATIIIPTMCRINHLKRCLSSLASNKLARYTELYIGVDYPPESRFVDGWKAVLNYVNNELDGFAYIHIFNHKENLGAEKNALFLLKKAKERHDRFIFSEDDNEFAKDYLEYCNKLLDQYEQDEDIIAISGYNYPGCSVIHCDKEYTSDVYFAAYGFASWYNKFDRMLDTLTTDWVRSVYCSRVFMNRLLHRAPNQYCNFVKGMLGYTTPIERNNDVWKSDVVYGIYMFLSAKKMLFPTVSKVRNWGFDGTGDNCGEILPNDSKRVTHRNFDVNSQLLDDENDYIYNGLVNDDEQARILEAVNSYFHIPNYEIVRTRIAYIISRFLGLALMRNMLK